MKNKSLRIISIVVIIYMLLALLWWAVLLHRKNNELFVLRADHLRTEYIQTTGNADIDISTLPQYATLKSYYNRQMYMILGEAAVFGLTLILGIYLINRAFVRELSAAEKQKNFLLSITHELKSPLASINLIFSTFLRRELPNSTVQELSQDGLKESTRLEDLFNKILIATRLDKAYVFNMEESNLSDILRSVVSRFENLHSDLVLVKNIQDNVICNIDRESIVSVIKNLLENAYKYSPNEKHISVSLVTKGDKTLLTFSDKGIGIKKEEQSKIFEQFYRIGDEETRSSKGTGLGLYIVKKIVVAHKGKIKIDSNNGGGTKFIITL